MSESDIKNLIINHSKRLQKLKEEQAHKGYDTPPQILIEIEEIEEKIGQLQKSLPEIKSRKSAQPKILVVDNEPDFLDTIVGILSDEGYKVNSASNEAQTFEITEKEKFDFAIIDVRLAGEEEDDETGFALALAIRNLNPTTCVIPITGYIKTRQIVRALKIYGFDWYVEKGPDVDKEILAFISEYHKTA